MADPLIGKFFSSYLDSKTEPGARDIVWNGQVRSRVKEGLYLVKIMNAVTLVLTGMVDWDRQVMVSLDEMKGWEFFDSREAWAENFGAWVRQDRAESQHSHAESGTSPGTGR
jgi:hypothetical protein